MYYVRQAGHRGRSTTCRSCFRRQPLLPQIRGYLACRGIRIPHFATRLLTLVATASRVSLLSITQLQSPQLENSPTHLPHAGETLIPPEGPFEPMPVQPFEEDIPQRSSDMLAGNFFHAL